MTEPDTATIVGQSKYEGLTGASSQDQEVYVRAAKASFLNITGWTWETLPPGKEPLAEMSVRGLAEQVAIQTSPEIIETLADWDLIASFSAGQYSETRRSAEDAFKARELNPWPWLNQLLWGLLEPNKFDWWRTFFSGENPPAWGIQSVTWGDPTGISAYE